MHRLRPYAPALILLVGYAFVWQTRRQDAVPLARPLTSILADVADYTVTNQTLSREEQRVAGMTDYVARSYERSGTVAFTTLVSYYARQTQGKTIHSPRNCLPGAGWEIVQGGTTLVAVHGAALPVNRFVLRNGSATAIAYYWYQGRGRITANEYTVKWNLLRDAALRGRSEEALVRIVVPVPSSPAPALEPSAEVWRQADETAHTVAARMIREVAAVLPRGRANGS